MEVPVARRRRGEGAQGQGRRQGFRGLARADARSRRRRGRDAAAAKPAAANPPGAPRRSAAPKPRRRRRPRTPPARSAQRSGAAPALLPPRGRGRGRLRAARTRVPSVRRFARELGVDLGAREGHGAEGAHRSRRTCRTTSRASSRARAAPKAALGLNLPPLPQVDFAKFGPVTTQPLSRIKKLSGAILHRNWVTIPHVTQHDEADITELEEFRKIQAEEAKKQGIRFTMLCFLLKAVVVALKQYPEFNASLSADGESLVLKQYFHIGVAVDTPNGLVVPVIRDVDKKGLMELAKELGEVSARMRAGKISPADLQGGCFSISSLGGIGGTHFTPIINAPEVAILGVGKSVMRPVWNGKEFAAAADAAAVAVLRPPRDRRRAGRALHLVPEQRALRHPPPRPVKREASVSVSAIFASPRPSSLIPRAVERCQPPPSAFSAARSTRSTSATCAWRRSSARRCARRGALRAERHAAASQRARASTAEHRLAMVRLAVAGNPRFNVDEREVRRAGPGYTFDTLAELRAEAGGIAPARAARSARTPFSNSRPGTAGTRSSGSRTSSSPTAPASRSSAGPSACRSRSRASTRRASCSSRWRSTSRPPGGIVVVPFTALDISATAIRDMLRRGRAARAICSPIRFSIIFERKGLYSGGRMRARQAGQGHRRGAGRHQGARHRGAGRQEDDGAVRQGHHRERRLGPPGQGAFQQSPGKAEGARRARSRRGGRADGRMDTGGPRLRSSFTSCSPPSASTTTSKSCGRRRRAPRRRRASSAAR